MSDVFAAEKAARRKAAFARRKAAHADGGAARAVAAADRFVDALADAPSIAAVYAPIRTEIDVGPLAARLEARGAALCLPVIEAAGRPLTFRAWSLGAPLVDGPFGARIPAGGDALAPDLVVVPLVAFDRRCARLGYGGGFYDRTLAALAARQRTVAIGLAYAAQEDPEPLPTEPTDWPLDAVVTEAETIARKALSDPGAAR